MPAFSLMDATILVHDQDLSGYTNSVTLAAEAEALDSTTFRSGGARERVAGLKTTGLDASGMWDPAPDAAIFADLEASTVNRAVTVSPGDAEGDTAYLFRAGYFSYSQLGDVGAVAPFSLSMMGTSREGLIKGAVTKARGAVAATGATGSPVQLPAVASGQFLYAALHIFSAATTVTAVLESDSANNFPTAATQITFGPILATTGGFWGVRVAGPITDTWYRLRVTGITGSHNIACSVGIG